VRATENSPPSHLVLDCLPVSFWIFCGQASHAFDLVPKAFSAFQNGGRAAILKIIEKKALGARLIMPPKEIVKFSNSS